MKIFNVLILLLLWQNSVVACECVPLGKLTENELKNYQSIALVKVTKIVESYQRLRESPFPAYKIQVKTLEHYKGDTLIELIVDGGHPKFETWTSCPLHLNEGEEWLIFTRPLEQNQQIIQVCDRNTPYRAVTGLRYWQYTWMFSTLAFLDSVYHKTKFAKKGKHEAFYENGQKEVEEVYKHGKLSGLRQIWYPNGQIFAEMLYKRGKLNGVTKWYNEKGNLVRWIEYVENQEVHSKTYRTNLTEKGIEVYYLDEEIFKDWKKNIAIHLYYHPNGKIGYKSKKSLKTGRSIGLEEQWDETGKLIRTIEYNKDGEEIDIENY